MNFVKLSTWAKRWWRCISFSGTKTLLFNASEQVFQWIKFPPEELDKYSSYFVIGCACIIFCNILVEILSFTILSAVPIPCFFLIARDFKFLSSFSPFVFVKWISCFWNCNDRRTYFPLRSLSICANFWQYVLTRWWMDSNTSSAKNPTVWYFSNTGVTVCVIKWCIFIVVEKSSTLPTTFANKSISRARSNLSDLVKIREALKISMILLQWEKHGFNYSVSFLIVCFTLSFSFSYASSMLEKSSSQFTISLV